MPKIQITIDLSATHMANESNESLFDRVENDMLGLLEDAREVAIIREDSTDVRYVAYMTNPSMYIELSEEPV